MPIFWHTDIMNWEIQIQATISSYESKSLMAGAHVFLFIHICRYIFIVIVKVKNNRQVLNVKIKNHLPSKHFAHMVSSWIRFMGLNAEQYRTSEEQAIFWLSFAKW